MVERNELRSAVALMIVGMTALLIQLTNLAFRFVMRAALKIVFIPFIPHWSTQHPMDHRLGQD